MQRQCGVARHLVDRLPTEREGHSVAWQASLPQYSFRRPAIGVFGSAYQIGLNDVRMTALKPGQLCSAPVLST
jgi:hypothetical protein